MDERIKQNLDILWGGIAIGIAFIIVTIFINCHYQWWTWC